MAGNPWSGWSYLDEVKLGSVSKLTHIDAYESVVEDAWRSPEDPTVASHQVANSNIDQRRPHVVFFNISQTGHVNPTLPIVRCLVGNGCQVTYYLTSKDHRDAVSATGASPRIVSPLETSVLSSRPSLLDLPGAALDALPWLVDNMKTLEPKPSVVVYDVLAKWGGWIAKLLGLSAVCSSSTFVLDRGEMCSINPQPTHAHKAALAELSQRYHIDVQWEDALTEYGQTTIVYTTPSLQPRGDWEASTERRFHFVGAMVQSSSCGNDDFVESVAKRRDAIGATAVVYVSMGTAVSTGAKFWKIVMRAFPQTSGVLVVCALGRFADDEEVTYRPAGPNVITQRRVPQAVLLESGLVDVFVTHGGMNSIHESLYHGVPMVCLPHIGDQMYNANIVQSLGLGIMIDGLGVTCAGLQDAVHQIISEQHFHQCAKAIGDEMKDVSFGPDAAAAIILDASNRPTSG